MRKKENPTVLVIVLDAVGINTLQNYLDKTSIEVKLPNLSKLGLGNVLSSRYNEIIKPFEDAELSLVLEPSSVWTDSLMGHRELMGYIDPENYELFKEGFPKDFVKALSKKIGKQVIYNKRAGGTQAIEENHDEHMKTKGVVLYASMCDPIAQLAANEKIINPKDLGKFAKDAFEIAKQQNIRLTRVISRPYVVRDKEFIRTGNRKDIVINLPQGTKTFIDIARENNVFTVSIGKSADVVNTKWDVDRNLSGKLPLELEFMFVNDKKKDKNPYCIKEVLAILGEAKKDNKPTFILCNLPDNDSLYGHTRDLDGNINSIMAFDKAIPLLEKAMPKNSFLIITSDHGMKDGGDYGYHSHEPVPVLGKGYNGPKINKIVDIPKSRKTYAVVGYICASIFGFENEYISKCNLDKFID